MSDINGYEPNSPKAADYADGIAAGADERRAEHDYWASVDRDDYERAVAEEQHEVCS